MSYYSKFLSIFKQKSNNDFTIPIDLLPYVTPFGSRVVGGYLPSSDVDLLANDKYSSTILNILGTLSIPYTTADGYEQTVRQITFLYNNFKFQISVVDDFQYPKTLKTITLVEAYFKEYPANVNIKAYRIKIFSTFYTYFAFNYLPPKPFQAFIIKHFPEYII